MRVLLISKFLHHVGGVETYVLWLARALQEAGHAVAVVGMQPGPGQTEMSFGDADLFRTPRRDFLDGTLAARAIDAASSVYSTSAGRVMREAVEVFRPDVAHFHGTCYQLTSSVYRVAQRVGLARVATQHEYKLVCANQRLWDDSRSAVCTACIGATTGRRYVAPLRRRCIKGSLGASAVGATEDFVSGKVLRSDEALLLHAPSQFMATSLRSDGWPTRRVRYLDLPWPHGKVRASERDTAGPRPSGYLYLGRLAPEKDVATLLRAWGDVAGRIPQRSLRIAGDGTDSERLHQLVKDLDLPSVTLLGRLDQTALAEELQSAHKTVHPSAWFENSPLAVRESLCAGVPALVADAGGMPELVERDVTGSVVHHSREGWAGALLAGSSGWPTSRADVAAYVRETRPGPDQHLAELLGLYGECQQSARGHVATGSRR